MPNIVTCLASRAPSASARRFAINGAVVAGMLFYLAPQFVPRDPPTILETTNVPIPPDPKPIEKPKRSSRSNA